MLGKFAWCQCNTGFGSFPPKECIPDTVNGAKYVRDLYEKSNDSSGETIMIKTA